jgi:hypothetical protein
VYIITCQVVLPNFIYQFIITYLLMAYHSKNSAIIYLKLLNYLSTIIIFYICLILKILLYFEIYYICIGFGRMRVYMHFNGSNKGSSKLV